MKKKILLTGATGFVGRNLLKRLIGRGYNVKCIIRDKKKLIQMKNLDAEFILGDITKKNSIKNCMHDVDLVFHLAVMVSIAECLKDPTKALEVNTLGTLNLLEEIRKETEKANKDIFFIYLSSDKVYGKSKLRIVNEEAPTSPLDPYSVSKVSSELLIKCYNKCYKNPSYICLRSANIYGYGQSESFFIPSIIKQIVKGKNKVEIGNVDYYRNFVYVDDLIDALVFVLEKRENCKNQVFNIAESSVKIASVLNSIKKLSANYLNRSIEFHKNEKFVRPSALEISKMVLDCSKIAEIGWKPQTDFDSGLRKTFEAFIKNG